MYSIKSIAKIHKSNCKKYLYVVESIVASLLFHAENSSSFDLDNSTLEVTRRPEVVHHAVTAALLLANLEAPHGLQLSLGHLNRLPELTSYHTVNSLAFILENNPGDRLKQRRSGQRSGVGEECFVSGEVLCGVYEVLVLSHALVLGRHRAQVAADLLKLLVRLPRLEEHPEDSEAVRLVHGLGGLPVLGVIVDDMELRVILHPVNGVLAAALAILLAPVGVHLENLKADNCLCWPHFSLPTLYSPSRGPPLRLVPSASKSILQLEPVLTSFTLAGS